MFKRLIVLCLVAGGLLAAQDPPSRAGRLSYKSGAVSFQPGGVNDWVEATLNRPLTAGDQVFADTGARAEIQVPGASFRIGSRTAFEFLNLDDRNVQVRLSEGSLIVRVRELYGANLEVDTPNAALSITAPGEYRIDANPDANETYSTVRSGAEQVTANAGSFALQARQQAVINGQDQSAQYQVYAAPGYDEFDNWASSRDRRDEQRVSSRYVPASVVGYGDLDDYGNWQSVPEYGNVWIPRDVPAGWAPYSDGHWAWIDPWGWSWVDDAPWGFAPFHYGRWAHFGNRWGWAPGPLRQTPVYAPALVAWIGGGSGGLSVSASFGGGPSVGWFPLGPRDVYIPAYRATPAYVNRVNVTNTTVINNVNVTNVYNNYVRTGSVPITGYAYHGVPGAVTAIPQSALTGARSVKQAAIRVDPNRIQSIATAVPAPRLAPQAASVLGRQAPSTSVPRPSAAVLNRTVVARATPPRAASFAERQPLLARNPGQPLPIQQQRQLASGTPPQVRVMAQARPVTPVRSNAPSPRAGVAAEARPPAATQAPQPPVVPAAPRASQPLPSRSPARAQPPAVQRPTEPARPQTPVRPEVQPRQVEPPTAQRPVPAAPSQTPVRPQVQPRPYEAPAVQRPPQSGSPQAPVRPQAQQPRQPEPPPQRPPQTEVHRPENVPARAPVAQPPQREAPRPQVRPAQPAERPEPNPHPEPPKASPPKSQQGGRPDDDRK